MTRAAIVVAALAACGPVPHRHYAYDAESRAPPPQGPTFALLGSDAAAVTVELAGDSQPYHYVLHREPSGVDADLRAVVIAGRDVFAAGDGGTVLHRAAGDAGWLREATPSTQRIRALLAGSAGELYAAGDGGTVLRRSPAGAWTVEPTPVTVDLHDLAAGSPGVVYAVGDGGTLLERRDGAWRAIATHTGADLRRFDGRIAIGLGGAIVDCAFWDRDQRELARAFVCVPRPSPTHDDLLARTGGGDYSVWHAYGAAGASLAPAHVGPLDAQLEPAIAGAPTITAAIDNHFYSSAGPLPTILVGRGGVVVFVGRPQRGAVAAIDGAPDLFGVASESLDAFAVGARGTIVHLQTQGVYVPQVYAL